MRIRYPTKSINKVTEIEKRNVNSLYSYGLRPISKDLLLVSIHYIFNSGCQTINKLRCSITPPNRLRSSIKPNSPRQDLYLALTKDFK